MLAALVAFANGAAGAVFGVALAVAALCCLGAAKFDPSPLLAAYRDADNRVRAASLAHLQRVGFTELLLLRNEMESCIAEYPQVESKLSRDVANLQANRKARQLHAFLDRCLLRRVKISGIGQAKMAALASFGIESAADVDFAKVMAVPGFGEALTQKLLKWRGEQEAKFRYNPAPGSVGAASRRRVAGRGRRQTHPVAGQTSSWLDGAPNCTIEAGQRQSIRGPRFGPGAVRSCSRGPRLCLRGREGAAARPSQSLGPNARATGTDSAGAASEVRDRCAAAASHLDLSCASIATNLSGVQLKHGPAPSPQGASRWELFLGLLALPPVQRRQKLILFS